MASDDAAQPTLERPEGCRLEEFRKYFKADDFGCCSREFVGGSFHAQADIPKDSLQGAGETLVANSCGAPQPAVARDDAALLALKDKPVEKTQGSAGEQSSRKRRCMARAPLTKERLYEPPEFRLPS